MENHFAASNFTKAASELKENIYAFENEWRGKKKIDDNDKQLFERALKEGVSSAHDIVRNQRDDYFTASAPPKINIIKLLGKASTDVASLFSTYRSQKLTTTLSAEVDSDAKKAAKELLLADIAKLINIVNARNELISEKRNNLKEPDITEADREYLETYLKTLVSAQRESEELMGNKTIALAGAT